MNQKVLESLRVKYTQWIDCRVAYVSWAVEAAMRLEAVYGCERQRERRTVRDDDYRANERRGKCGIICESWQYQSSSEYGWKAESWWLTMCHTVDDLVGGNGGGS